MIRFLCVGIMLQSLWCSLAVGAEPAVYWVDLNPVEVESYQYTEELQEKRNGAFRKEPDWGGRTVFRYVLNSGCAGHEMGLVYDQTRGVLHVDMNRNFDLTDDPKGVFKSQFIPGTFEDIRIPTDHGVVAVDITFMKLLTNMFADMTIRTGFSGILDLPGGRRRIGVIDNLDGVFGAEDDLYVGPPPGPGKDLAAEGDLFDDGWKLGFDSLLLLDGRLYRVSAHTEEGKFRLKLVEVAMSRSGMVRFKGGNVVRCYLKGKRSILVDRPAESALWVPPGRYQASVYVGANGFPSFVTDGVWVTVAEKKSSAVDAGSPLVNSLDAAGRLGTWDFNYKLVDRAGHRYRAIDSAPLDGPMLEIRRNDKVIYSGRFEYG